MGSGQSTDPQVQQTAASMQQQLLPNNQQTTTEDTPQTPQQNNQNTERIESPPNTTTTTAASVLPPVKPPTSRISTSVTTTSNVPLPQSIGLSPAMTTDNIISKSDIENYFKTDFEVRIDPLIFQINKEIIQLRRYFHENPELSFKEFKTANSIAKFLKSREIEVYENIGQTGVVGILRGTGGDNNNNDNNNSNGPCIMLRADMDALPVLEEKTEFNKDYISEVQGVSHACGHDAHMAILLGTARVLCKLREYLHGTVKFCFQPAEESGAGAKAMIKEGILDGTNSSTNNNNNNNNIRVDQVYGLHVWSYIPFGQCQVQCSALMAGCVIYSIDVIGRGGHGAIPKGTNDAVLAVSHLTQQLQSIISRNINAVERGVVTVGKIEAGTKSNVIAESARIEGTIRWFDEEIYKIILNRINDILRGIEISFNVKCELKMITEPLNPVINTDEGCVRNVKNAVSQVLPDDNSIIEGKPTMAAEDFGVFLENRPGCFFLLGCGIENKNIAHHTPNFEIDERCLTVGTQIMCTLVLDLLLPNVE